MSVFGIEVACGRFDVPEAMKQGESVMDVHAQQLVRLAELLNVSAVTLRDLNHVRVADRETSTLDLVADEIERLSAEVNRIGVLETIAPP